MYVYACMYVYIYIYICIHTQYTHRYKSIYTDTSQTYIQKGMKHADCFFVSWLWQNKCALKCVVFEQVEREVLRWTSSSNRLAGSQATCETHWGSSRLTFVWTQHCTDLQTISTMHVCGLWKTCRLTERSWHRGAIAWHRKTRTVWVLEWALGAATNTQYLKNPSVQRRTGVVGSEWQVGGLQFAWTHRNVSLACFHCHNVRLPCMSQKGNWRTPLGGKTWR